MPAAYRPEIILREAEKTKILWKRKIFNISHRCEML